MASLQLEWANMGTPDPNQVVHVCKKFTDDGWTVLQILPLPVMTLASAQPQMIIFVYAFKPSAECAEQQPPPAEGETKISFDS